MVATRFQAAAAQARADAAAWAELAHSVVTNDLIFATLWEHLPHADKVAVRQVRVRLRELSDDSVTELRMSW